MILKCFGNGISGNGETNSVCRSSHAGLAARFQQLPRINQMLTDILSSSSHIQVFQCSSVTYLQENRVGKALTSCHSGSQG